MIAVENLGCSPVVARTSRRKVVGCISESTEVDKAGKGKESC